ncbi:MAG: glycosyltransferase [Erythrobacter sp.]|uniref:glycosyltransferase n=1 Tax=Erythrobacter sp. TaxID=1042 RepID=UPI0026201210|nr:glycosyltransferase [Erythrobacter sp.]MDJ0978043.1 glycosyltransferase [Erythrobacter sp.]
MPYVHSIYLTGEESTSELPWAIERNIESLAHHHAEFEPKLWDDVSGRRFIEQHFDASVLYAWDELVPLAYRSDLLRFCLLSKLGGIYADVSVHCFAPLLKAPEAPGKESVILFRDIFNRVPWIMSVSLMHAPPGVELFANCVDRIASNVREGFYGTNALCPTGPNLLGREAAIWGGLDRIDLGDCASIIRGDGGPIIGRTFIDAPGRLVAVVAKSGTGLASLGAKKQNNYNTFYDRRKIYRRQLSAPDIWTISDYMERQMHNGAPSSSEDELSFDAGCALYGPYVTLDAGRYTARFVFDGKAPKGADVDVVSGPKQLKEAQAPRISGNALECDFEIHERETSVEIRLFLDAPDRLAFKCLELISHTDEAG